MKNKRLSLVSLFLAFVMILSTFTGVISISAEDTVVSGGTFEIWRGGEKVKTVSAATTITGAKDSNENALVQSGDTIKLKSDYVMTAREDLAYKELIIDGQGYKISETTGINRLFNYTYSCDAEENAGTLTFKNVTLESTQSSIQSNSKYGTLILDGVTVTCAGNTNIIVANADNQVLTIQNSKINSTSAITTNNTHIILMNKTDGTLNLTNTTIAGTGACGTTNNSMICLTAGTTANISNCTIKHSGTSGKMIYLNGNGATLTLEDTILSQTFNTSAIWAVSGTGHTITLKGEIIASTTAPAHAIVRFDSGATGSTLNVKDATVLEMNASSKNGYFTRLMSSYAASTSVKVSDSKILVASGQSAFEFLGAGTAEAPNKAEISNSTIYVTRGGDVIEARPYQNKNSTTYVIGDHTNITVTNSTLYANSGNGISVENATVTTQLDDSTTEDVDETETDTVNTSNCSVSVSGSTIVSRGGNAILGQSDTTIEVIGSKLGAPAKASVTGGNNPTVQSTDRYDSTGLSIGTDITVSAENADEVAGQFGLVFRVKSEADAYANGAFTGYYRNFADAWSARGTATTIYMVGNYVDAGTYHVLNANVTIEGVGATRPCWVSGSNERVFQIPNSATLKNIGIYSVDSYKGGIQIQANQTLTLDNAEVLGAGLYMIILQDSANISMKNNSTLSEYYGLEPILVNSAKSAITLEKSNIKVFGTGRAIYVKGSGNTLTMDKDSAITTDKGLYAIYWESTAHLTIENSVVNVNDAISVFAFTSGETGTTLNIINSEIYMHAKDYVGTTHGIIKDTAAGNDTINIVNSKLDASDTNARRVMYLHSGSTGSVVNVTDSILIGSSSSGACPPIKAVTSTLHLTGVNQISGGWSYITTGGACEATDKSIYGNWMIEDHAKTTQVEAQLGTNGTTVGVDVEKVVDGNNSIRATSRVEAVKINEWRMMIKNSNGTFDEADVTYGTVFFRVADYEAWLANNAGKSVADFIAAADGTTYTVVKVAADSNGLYLANDGDLLINAELTGVDALASTEIGVVSYIACDGTPVFYSSYNGDNTDTIAVGTAA